MLKIILPIACVASLCLLAVMLNFTTPVTAGPFGVVAIFILLYILCLGCVTEAIYYFSKLVSHLSAVAITKRPLSALSLRHSYYFSTIIAAAPVILIGLQSVGHVGVYEYFLVAIFEVVGCVYIYKRIK